MLADSSGNRIDPVIDRVCGCSIAVVSNCAAFKNITLQRLQAQNGVSYCTPLLRSTLTW